MNRIIIIIIRSYYLQHESALINWTIWIVFFSCQAIKKTIFCSNCVFPQNQNKISRLVFLITQFLHSQNAIHSKHFMLSDKRKCFVEGIMRKVLKFEVIGKETLEKTRGRKSSLTDLFSLKPVLKIFPAWPSGYISAAVARFSPKMELGIAAILNFDLVNSLTLWSGLYETRKSLWKSIFEIIELSRKLFQWCAEIASEALDIKPVSPSLVRHHIFAAGNSLRKRTSLLSTSLFHFPLFHCSAVSCHDPQSRSRLNSRLTEVFVLRTLRLRVHLRIPCPHGSGTKQPNGKNKNRWFVSA